MDSPFHTLQDLTSTAGVTFYFEPHIAKEFGLTPSFDRAPVCRTFATRGVCELGESCPLRHPPRGKTVVCKHWLRGLCKKGDACEFLHEYNMRKMPECWFYSKYKECSNSECIYLHIDPNSKIKDCAHYSRGFCRLGPNCRSRHQRQPRPCSLYLAGFCPHGPLCLLPHPRFEQWPGPGTKASAQRGLSGIVCYRCGMKGHYANHCQLK